MGSERICNYHSEMEFVVHFLGLGEYLQAGGQVLNLVLSASCCKHSSYSLSDPNSYAILMTTYFVFMKEYCMISHSMNILWSVT
jgi:hypothetical protein